MIAAFPMLQRMHAAGVSHASVSRIAIAVGHSDRRTSVLARLRLLKRDGLVCSGDEVVWTITPAGLDALADRAAP